MTRQPLQPGDPRRVGRWRLRARLGAGGMGIVYIAERRDGLTAALKLVRPELAADYAFRVRFGREVSAARAVSGICTARVLDADATGDQPFLVTELIEGPSLHERVAICGPLAPTQLVPLAVGLAEALDAISGAGLIHRDLKPSNVMLAADGPKVIDFGIAYAMEATALTATRTAVGSASFMSPEQARGDRLSSASDVFSWAGTLVFAASGQPPFGDGRPEAVLYRVMHEEPDLRHVPANVRHVVEQCLSKDPTRRPSPSDLVAALVGRRDVRETATLLLNREWESQPTLAPAYATSVSVPSTPRRVRGRLALAIVAGATAMGAAIGYLTTLEASPGASTQAAATARSQDTGQPSATPSPTRTSKTLAATQQPASSTRRKTARPASSPSSTRSSSTGPTYPYRFNPSSLNCEPSPNTSSIDWVAQTSAPRGTHSYSTDGAAAIGLRNKWGGLDAMIVESAVRDPSGQWTFASTTLTGDEWAELDYPTDFPAVTRPSSGIYTIFWRDARGRALTCDGFVAGP